MILSIRNRTAKDTTTGSFQIQEYCDFFYYNVQCLVTIWRNFKIMACIPSKVRLKMCWLKKGNIVKCQKMMKSTDYS